MAPKYKIRQFTCAGCLAQVTKRGPSSRKYCSLPCYRASKRPQRKTGEMTTCKQCSDPIYVRPSQRKSGKQFCSIVCANEWQGRNKTVHKCKTCLAEFRWSPSRIKSMNPTYCSIKCRNTCPEWMRKFSVEGNLRQQRSKSPNKLEICGCSIINDLGVAYETQFLIEDKFVVDVYVEFCKLVIQWDGDYWHGYKKNGNTTPLDDRQRKRVRLDKAQDAYMSKCGIRVLRFWEHDVYKNREVVSETISNAIRFTT